MTATSRRASNGSAGNGCSYNVWSQAAVYLLCNFLSDDRRWQGIMQALAPEHRKTFLLGLGTQKAASTWLVKYLVKEKGVRFGFAAKYHIWDVAEEQYVPPQFPQDRKEWRRLVMRRFPAYYFHHFARILKDDAVHLTGDLSPSYCSLPQERIAYIVERFERRGIDTKAVFLMRDPVERCISAAAMWRRKSEAAAGLSVEEVLIRRYNSPNCEARTRYPATLKAAEGALGDGKLHIGIFENMFEEPNLRALTEFLGVSLKTDKASDVRNAGEREKPVSEETRALVANHYRDVYLYCAGRFPQVKRLWGGFRYLDLP